MQMREILFRGKRIDNDEWVCGSFCMDAIEQFKGPVGVDGFIRLYDKAKDKMQMHEVDRETVGQYTGLKDKNGNRIFEGDIIRAWNGQCGEVKWGHHVNAEYGLDTYGWFVLIDDCATTLDNDWHGHEVIGNVHDNPELMGGVDGG